MQIGTWTCLDCGCEFYEPHEFYEHHGFDQPPFERWLSCPYCGGSYLRTHLCDRCGHRIFGEYIRLSSGEEICQDCFSVREIGT